MLHRPVQPLLTEDEIRSGQPYERGESDVDLNQTDMGGCCCDCCHVNGLNFGSKFPHVSNANQCMTPQMFNCLCRLGFEISEEAIRSISRPGGLGDEWEKFVYTCGG